MLLLGIIMITHTNNNIYIETMITTVVTTIIMIIYKVHVEQNNVSAWDKACDLRAFIS